MIYAIIVQFYNFDVYCNINNKSLHKPLWLQIRTYKIPQK